MDYASTWFIDVFIFSAYAADGQIQRHRSMELCSSMYSLVLTTGTGRMMSTLERSNDKSEFDLDSVCLPTAETEVGEAEQR